MVTALVTLLLWTTLASPHVLSWDQDCLQDIDAGRFKKTLEALEAAVEPGSRKKQATSAFASQVRARQQELALARPARRPRLQRRLGAAGRTEAARDQLLSALLTASEVASGHRGTAKYLPHLVMDVLPDASEVTALAQMVPCVSKLEEMPSFELVGSGRAAPLTSDEVTTDWEEIAGTFSDPLAPSQWYMGTKNKLARSNVGMDWVGAWQHARTLGEPTPVDILVIDSECEVEQDFNWTDFDCASDGTDEDGDGFADNCRGWDFASSSGDTSHTGEFSPYHGTNVAAIIASKDDNVGLTSTCRHCRIHCLKVTDAAGELSATLLFEAFDYLLANADRYRLSNHSYGSTAMSHAMLDVFRRLDEAGHVSVAALGNTGCDFGIDGKGGCTLNGKWVTGVYPAMFDLPNVISVGSTNTAGIVAGFSNFGSGAANVFAPGDQMPMALPGNAAKPLSNGTSFSAPLVTAAIGHSWGYFPAFDAQKIRRAVEDCSPMNNVLSFQGDNGILNVKALLQTFEGDGVAPELTTYSPEISTTSNGRILAATAVSAVWMLLV